jgi:hypothetical protein
MNLLNKWLMPALFVVAGIALFMGWLLPALGGGTGLRQILGLVVILFGLQRAAQARIPRQTGRRRFGGGRRRPWEE